MKFLYSAVNNSDDMLTVCDDGVPILTLQPKQGLCWSQPEIQVHGVIRLSASGRVEFVDVSKNSMTYAGGYEFVYQDKSQPQ